MDTMLAETMKNPNAHGPGSVLGPHDFVGQTFYIACNAMLAFTFFFFIQVGLAPKAWQPSVCIAGIVTGVAFYNYTYMKAQWVDTQQSPTVYRYTDWLITVPLQIVEFYFILKACGPVSGALCMRLLVMSVGMIVFGWLAEVDIMAKLVGFTGGMVCWLYILFEVFAGEAAGCAQNLMKNSAAQGAFNTLRLIVSIGWSMYPIGFAVTYLMGAQHGEAPPESLNVVYNLADLINKGAFGVCIWYASRGATADNGEPLLGK